jgi:flavin-dependent dehydrogenase
MIQKAYTDKDVVIIGAGIAGCIAAIALVDDYSVALIDKLPEPVDRIGESLAPATRRILKRLRLLENLETQIERELFINNPGIQSYWGSERVNIKDHLRDPDGLGRNLNRKAFDSYLRTTAIDRGVDCIWPATVHHSSLVDSCWQVAIRSADTKNAETGCITAKFVIDATGRQSHFARGLGVRRRRDDKLIACWASMPNTSENRMSTISADELGWWYSAVVPNDKRVLAFHTDSDLIDRGMIKNVDAFLHLSKSNSAVARILDQTKGNIAYHGTVAANSTRLKQVAGKGWAALGDAAISFDPLSSQGMFHAMASAMQLKELITRFDVVPNSHELKTMQFQGEYARQTDHIWEHYVKHKNLFYRAEMRWPDSPFWKRRHCAVW